MIPVRENIARAWELRVNLEYEGCLGRLAEIKERLGIPAGELSPVVVEELTRRNESTDIADTLMLSASLRRALGDPAGADAIVEALDRALGRETGKRSFRFYYEKGRVAFSRGDFHAALEEFLRASLLCGDDRDRLWALGNVVFCMENLGLPYGRTLEEVQRLLAKQHPGVALERVQAQLYAFELRAAFRAGRPAELFASTTPSDSLDQARYFSYWARLLPYHRFHRQLLPSELDAFSAPATLQYPFYKLRTLQGMLHPEDLKGIRPSETIDRLYLWVWRWLADPTTFPIQRVLTLMEGMDCHAVLYRCTVEDSQLLRNALLWLGLFDPAAESLVRECTAPLEAQRAEQEYPLLTFESHVVQYLYALRRGDAIVARDFRQTLESHPLWRSEELRFRALVEAVDGKSTTDAPLQNLAVCLREILPREDGGAPSGLVVDLAHQQLVDSRRGLQIVSEPMCQALLLLRSGEPVPCERFVQVCFGLSEFDPLIHTGKIFNLLSRLKKAVGGAPTFHLKTGAILARGDWSHIVFREARVRVNLVPLLFVWKRGKAPVTSTPRRVPPPVPRRPTVSHETLRGWNWRNGLSRGEVERLLGLPRSTTNRWISKWVDGGVLRVTGKARTTRYYLLK